MFINIIYLMKMGSVFTCKDSNLKNIRNETWLENKLHLFKFLNIEDI